MRLSHNTVIACWLSTYYIIACASQYLVFHVWSPSVINPRVVFDRSPSVNAQKLIHLHVSFTNCSLDWLILFIFWPSIIVIKQRHRSTKEFTSRVSVTTCPIEARHRTDFRFKVIGPQTLFPARLLLLWEETYHPSHGPFMLRTGQD